MAVKLFLLNTGQTIISDAKIISKVSESPENDTDKEIKDDDKCVGYLLKKPQIVSILNEIVFDENENSDERVMESKTEIKVSMSPWIPLSEDEEIVVYPNAIVSIVEPVLSIKQMYEDKING